MLSFHIDERENAKYRGLVRPVIVCDHCGEVITHAGNVLYQKLKPDSKECLYVTNIYHVHKHCNREFDKRLGSRTSWIELSDYLVQLLTNTEMISEQAASQLISKTHKANKSYWQSRKEQGNLNED